mgnify:CR=1 FL=1
MKALFIPLLPLSAFPFVWIYNIFNINHPEYPYLVLVSTICLVLFFLVTMIRLYIKKLASIKQI